MTLVNDSSSPAPPKARDSGPPKRKPKRGETAEEFAPSLRELALELPQSWRRTAAAQLTRRGIDIGNPDQTESATIVAALTLQGSIYRSRLAKIRARAQAAAEARWQAAQAEANQDAEP